MIVTLYFSKPKKLRSFFNLYSTTWKKKFTLPYKFYVGYKILLLLNEVFPNNQLLTRSVICDYFIESLLLYEIRTHLSFGTGSAAGVDVFLYNKQELLPQRIVHIFTLIPPTKD